MDEKELERLQAKKHALVGERDSFDDVSHKLEQLHGDPDVDALRLKIYRRKGDYYGRQYPIAGGKWRLDLFCEDEKGTST